MGEAVPGFFARPRIVGRTIDGALRMLSLSI
jgi:hypothetical protein